MKLPSVLLALFILVQSPFAVAADRDPANVAQEIISAVRSDDGAAFASLKEQGARMYTSIPSVEGKAPWAIELLDSADIRDGFQGCELDPPKTVDEHLALVTARCGQEQAPKDSYFLVYDGKVRIFYKFMPPLMMLAPSPSQGAN